MKGSQRSARYRSLRNWTPEAYLRRLRRRRVAGVLFLVIGITALIYADRHGWLLHSGGDWNRYENTQARVVHIVDGDTLDVDIPDGDRATTRIRLWGIDTPELAREQDNKPAQPLAHEATEMTRRLAMDQTVRIRLQSHRVRDFYGRVLAYIELPDGTILNERLLEAGVARYDPRFEHRHLTRFELIEKQAKVDKIGLWASGANN